ncbi:hypothetical protein [Streptomyces sp. SYSU K21746]
MLLTLVPHDASPKKPLAGSATSAPQAQSDKRSGSPQPSNSAKESSTAHAGESGSAPTTSAPGLTRTEVRTIAPWAIGGMPAKDIVITMEAVGSCWSSSSKTQRTDAWRCTDDSTVLDPCFAPDAGPEHPMLLCMEADPNRMLRLTLTESLPGNNFHIPGGPVPTPLLLELVNGDICRFASGATDALVGQRLNYTCEQGGSVYGDPNQSRALWTAAYRADEASTTVSTPIRTVYQ